MRNLFYLIPIALFAMLWKYSERLSEPACRNYYTNTGTQAAIAELFERSSEAIQLLTKQDKIFLTQKGIDFYRQRNYLSLERWLCEVSPLVRLDPKPQPRTTLPSAPLSPPVATKIAPTTPQAPPQPIARQSPIPTAAIDLDWKSRRTPPVQVFNDSRWEVQLGKNPPDRPVSETEYVKISHRGLEILEIDGSIDVIPEVDLDGDNVQDLALSIYYGGSSGQFDCLVLLSSRNEPLTISSKGECLAIHRGGRDYLEVGIGIYLDGLPSVMQPGTNALIDVAALSLIGSTDSLDIALSDLQRVKLAAGSTPKRCEDLDDDVVSQLARVWMISLLSEQQGAIANVSSQMGCSTVKQFQCQLANKLMNAVKGEFTLAPGLALPGVIDACLVASRSPSRDLFLPRIDIVRPDSEPVPEQNVPTTGPFPPSGATQMEQAGPQAPAQVIAPLGPRVTSAIDSDLKSRRGRPIEILKRGDWTVAIGSNPADSPVELQQYAKIIFEDKEVMDKDGSISTIPDADFDGDGEDDLVVGVYSGGSGGAFGCYALLTSRMDPIVIRSVGECSKARRDEKDFLEIGVEIYLNQLPNSMLPGTRVLLDLSDFSLAGSTESSYTAWGELRMLLPIGSSAPANCEDLADDVLAKMVGAWLVSRIMNKPMRQSIRHLKSNFTAIARKCFNVH